MTALPSVQRLHTRYGGIADNTLYLDDGRSRAIFEIQLPDLSLVDDDTLEVATARLGVFLHALEFPFQLLTVTEQLPYLGQRGPGGKSPRGDPVAERMRAHRRKTCTRASSAHHLLHRIDADACLRGLDPAEEPPWGGFGPAAQDVGSQGLADVYWLRQALLVPALTRDDDLTM